MSSSKFFKCLGDETRLRCLMLLQARDALCVCDIAEALQSSQPKISRHLAQLRACDLVSDHREGQWVFYKLHPDLANWQREVLKSSRAALAAEVPFQEDFNRLESAECRKTSMRCP